MVQTSLLIFTNKRGVVLKSIRDAFVREQKRYTKKELQMLFSFNEHEVEQFIKTLKAYGVLKAVRFGTDQKEMSDLLDEDIEIMDETAGNRDCYYVFTYVGVITVGNCILKVFPKYILSKENPLEEMKQVIRVLKRYSNSDEQIVNLYNGSDENRSFNLLAVILYLLDDYHQYGVYDNSEEITEMNGEGDILWGKTIDEGFAYIEHNTPFYTELYTRRIIDDELDFFKRLHECILTECSEQLRESKLDELFQIVTVELSDEKLKEFGDREYIMDRILAELNIQYNTRKQILLKTLYAYVSQDKKMLDQDAGISMYGTTAFNMVWECACAEVFDNKLHTKLGKLTLPIPLHTDYMVDDTLIEVIQHPVWKRDNIIEEASETLRPDLISFTKIEGENYFIIFDAKYYNLVLEKGKLRGNPGVGDVDKQYLYQLAYRKFIERHGFDKVRNCFLMPTEKDEVIDMGIVSMPMLSELGLEDIIVKLIPATRLFELYLRQKKINISEEIKM